jgi:hypothetical protein
MDFTRAADDMISALRLMSFLHCFQCVVASHYGGICFEIVVKNSTELGWMGSHK